jgi:hypothetical protein
MELTPMETQNALTLPSHNLKFDNDFGTNPIAIGHLTDDSSQLAISYGLLGFVGFIIGGLPFAAYIGFLAVNDYTYLSRKSQGLKVNVATAQTSELLKILGESEPTPEVVSLPLVNPWLASTVVELPESIPAVGTPGFIAEMAHNVRSSLIVGIPGSGKGLTTANLIAKVRQYRPELQIFGTDPKNDPKETGYWQGYGYLDRFDMERLDPEDIQARLTNDLNRFLDAGDNTLWVIDEFATLIGMVGDKWLKGFNAKLQAIVQMGNSRSRYLWIVSQSGNLAELKLQPSLRSSLELLAIVRPGSDAAVAGLIRTDLIADKDTQRMQAAIESSPVGRAYYYGKSAKWLPMPVLPNPSGYDRDTRKWLSGFVPSEPPSQATEFDVAVVERMVGKPMLKSATAEMNFTATDTLEVQTPEGELLRYLNSVDDPKLVRDIRSSAKLPIKRMPSSELRQLLDKMVASGTIKTDGTRFYCE